MGAVEVSRLSQYTRDIENAKNKDLVYLKTAWVFLENTIDHMRIEQRQIQHEIEGEEGSDEEAG
jgi:hypothetical protein